jgi:hypothetical protein
MYIVKLFLLELRHLARFPESNLDEIWMGSKLKSFCWGWLESIGSSGVIIGVSSSRV